MTDEEKADLYKELVKEKRAEKDKKLKKKDKKRNMLDRLDNLAEMPLEDDDERIQNGDFV